MSLMMTLDKIVSHNWRLSENTEKLSRCKTLWTLLLKCTLQMNLVYWLNWIKTHYSLCMKASRWAEATLRSPFSPSWLSAIRWAVLRQLQTWQQDDVNLAGRWEVRVRFYKVFIHLGDFVNNMLVEGSAERRYALFLPFCLYCSLFLKHWDYRSFIGPPGHRLSSSTLAFPFLIMYFHLQVSINNFLLIIPIFLHVVFN